ncbi:hypothetical protein D1007_30489 [Hordeum vulgare]|nr:hypothetical protein D1007_30489 [Hordeum vulgare]
MKDLEGVAKKVDDTPKDKCCDLFSMAVTRVFNYPHFKFEEMMGPVLKESRGDLVTVVEGHMNTLLGMFFCGDGEEPDEETPVLVLK